MLGRTAPVKARPPEAKFVRLWTFVFSCGVFLFAAGHAKLMWKIRQLS
jgi:hypothetical protein